MKITADDYRLAAKERLEGTRLLLNSLSGEGAKTGYAAATYLAGVAIESMLRAYRVRVSDQLNSRHSLINLAIEARFTRRLRDEERTRLDADIVEASQLWNNVYRYLPDDRWLVHLLHAKIRVTTPEGLQPLAALGDEAGKRVAERMYELAANVVISGDIRWK